MASAVSERDAYAATVKSSRLLLPPMGISELHSQGVVSITTLAVTIRGSKDDALCHRATCYQAEIFHHVETHAKHHERQQECPQGQSENVYEFVHDSSSFCFSRSSTSPPPSISGGATTKRPPAVPCEAVSP